MHRRKFIGIAGGALIGAAGAGYFLSDKKNFIRSDVAATTTSTLPLKADEEEILYLASLAPSGHNTQPWLVTYLEPYHYLVGNDETKWLPAVDPTQRETILSIGAFVQNLEYAASHFGYSCQFETVAITNQDKNVIDVKLRKVPAMADYDVSHIKSRRTIRSGFTNDPIKAEDMNYLTGNDSAYLHYLPSSSKESQWLNGQTIEANKLQADRDAAQKELSDWIRFSSTDAKKFRDGLTTASMELDGIAGFITRNFYGKEEVMKRGFREKGIDKVRTQVAHSAGWIVITSDDNSVNTLVQTGMCMQRLFLKVRRKNIALHPMTQILEEASTNKVVNGSIGLSNPIQFILRVGYITDYPDPVSLRRPVNWFVKS